MGYARVAEAFLNLSTRFDVNIRVVTLIIECSHESVALPDDISGVLIEKNGPNKDGLPSFSDCSSASSFKKCAV